MNLGIAGRRAAVAAASAGLGFGTARALAAEGVRVAICGRHRDRIDAAVASLAAVGPDPIGLVADVSTPDGAASFVAEARAALGGLDILVTNAGGPPPGTFASTSLDAYAPALDLNLMSVVAMCTEAVPGLREQQWGRVVAITSITVRQPSPTLILSNTARAGATAFLKTLAREVAADGVTVNVVLPGHIAAEHSFDLFGSRARAESWARANVPAGRLGRIEELADVAAFLCSPRASYITGTDVLVDGGLMGAI